MNNKRLYRSRQDRMIAGVCGGIGRYLNVDPTFIRIALLILALWGGGGVLAYIIAWIVIPEEPLAESTSAMSVEPAAPPAPPAPAEPPTPAS